MRERYDSIRPGQVWLDTAGKRIQAHGGSVMYLDGRYYWYGENKEYTGLKPGVWHWGVRCYRSDDLYNWEDLGLIIPPDTEDPKSSLHPSSYMDRPHILFNEKTGKFDRTGTLKESRIDSIVKANNVTLDFMVQYTINGKEHGQCSADILQGPYPRPSLLCMNFHAAYFFLIVFCRIPSCEAMAIVY